MRAAHRSYVSVCCVGCGRFGHGRKQLLLGVVEVRVMWIVVQVSLSEDRIFLRIVADGTGSELR